MVGASISEPSAAVREVLSSISSRKRNCWSGDGAKRVDTEDNKRRLATLDLDILDCPICYDTLATPIFQCVNGHLACSSCCSKLSKCSVCGFAIGHIRCRAMESVLESAVVPCPNAKFGCTQSVTYGKESTHEKECTFSQKCSCPEKRCNYTGLYKDLYSHYISIHYISNCFHCGTSFRFQIKISNKILIIREVEKRLLFVVQCFRELCGVSVIVSCIAPSGPEVGEFSYCLPYSVDRHTVTYQSPKMKRIHRVSFENPKEDCILIPYKLLRRESLDMELLITENEENSESGLPRS